MARDSWRVRSRWHVHLYRTDEHVTDSVPNLGHFLGQKRKYYFSKFVLERRNVVSRMQGLKRNMTRFRNFRGLEVDHPDTSRGRCNWWSPPHGFRTFFCYWLMPFSLLSTLAWRDFRVTWKLTNLNIPSVHSHLQRSSPQAGSLARGNNRIPVDKSSATLFFPRHVWFVCRRSIKMHCLPYDIIDSPSYLVSPPPWTVPT